MRKKDINKFGKERKQIKSRGLDMEARTYARKHEINPKIRAILAIVAGLALIFAVFNADKLIEVRQKELTDLVEQAKKEQEQKRIAEQKSEDEIFRECIKKARIAFNKRDYFGSVFMYKQATMYHPSDTNVLKELIMALEYSCLGGYSMQCQQAERQRDKLSEIRQKKKIEPIIK